MPIEKFRVWKIIVENNRFTVWLAKANIMVKLGKYVW